MCLAWGFAIIAGRKQVKAMIVGIIGGGASGMVAALAAAENPEVQVVLMERQARLGRKLLATGNGRCNLTNLHASTQGYHGDAPEFVNTALTQFDPEMTLAWFRKLGLHTVAEPSGRVYPYSDQANSVVDVLRFALEKPNIRVLTGFEASKVRCAEGVFYVDGAEKSIVCDRLIIACGGLAGTKLGGSMSGYKLLGKLGHRSTRLRPALVQLKTPWEGITSLKGVRANCHVQILRDGEVFAQSTGEIQFTEFGVSGPVIFEISRDACYGSGDWRCCMDFLPSCSGEDLYEELGKRPDSLPVEELLTGILHNRLGRVLTKAAGVRGGRSVGALTEQQRSGVAYIVKHFTLPLSEPMGMDSAQVTAGGVLTDGFNPETMESKLVPGLYACGEVLDIDGDCGGYNLQWAWSSGRLAGLHAGKDN